MQRHFNQPGIRLTRVRICAWACVDYIVKRHRSGCNFNGRITANG
jgi:hypothetical protein